MEHHICGIFLTEYENAEKAKAVVESMKNCPHLIVAGSSGNRTSMAFIVPEILRWWFEGPAENPEVLGAKSVEVFIIDDIAYPDDFQLRIPETKTEVPPCGSNCNDCPMREQYNCPGCPATT